MDQNAAQFSLFPSKYGRGTLVTSKWAAAVITVVVVKGFAVVGGDVSAIVAEFVVGVGTDGGDWCGAGVGV